MADALDLILNHLELLFSYPDWLPIEKNEILFYCNQLKVKRDLSTWNLETGWGDNLNDVTTPKFNSLRDIVRRDVDHIGNRISFILDQKNGSKRGKELFFYGAPNLSNLGACLRYVVRQLYIINDNFCDKQDKYDANFFSGLCFRKENFLAYNPDFFLGSFYREENFQARDPQNFRTNWSTPGNSFTQSTLFTVSTRSTASTQFTTSTRVTASTRSTASTQFTTSTRVTASTRSATSTRSTPTNRMTRRHHSNFNREGEIFVGLDEEASNLLDRLTTITLKQLEFISIVGMGGLGKTTLARKVYEDPLIVYHFYVRAWVSVSQFYQKKDIFLGILSSVIDLTDEVCRMSANELGEILYQGLKGKRYLIVVDDIWNSKAWEEIKRSFPNDNNGSRIMLTTRLRDVALQFNKNPIFLRFLTNEESWDLFQKKVVLTRRYTKFNDSMQLHYIGKTITRKCQGFPLAIVVIAGLLKNNFNIDWWQKVARRVSSYIVSDSEQFMNSLALSYNHLPQHLKPCFLYLGVFPEDHEIPVQKLIWLWIAEGFICQIRGKGLEDVAEDYLMDLLNRNIFVVAKKGSNGGIKACRVHDLLRDLCLRKVEEEKFSTKMYRFLEGSYSCAHCSSSFASSSSHVLANSQLGLNVDDLDISSNCSPSPTNALSCLASKFIVSISKDISMIRVLDLSSIQLCIFPIELVELSHLRYIEIKFTYGSPPESVSNLVDLETLIMSSRSNIVIPPNLWKLVKMRHLYIRSGKAHVSIGDVTGLLENLQTISLVSPSRSCEHVLAMTPNLKKLGLCGPLKSKLGDLKFPDLGHLNRLETLKLLNTAPISGPIGGGASNSIMFPETLKRLTVSYTSLEWKEAWIFEMIPNLEVLKLKLHAFVGKEWETSEGVFRRLRFLKLEELDIEQWGASRNHFPLLERLVVHRCLNLSEIPSGLGDILTLEWIELSGCNESAMNSARDIQKEQEDNGNDWLKILISPFATSS